MSVAPPSPGNGASVPICSNIRGDDAFIEDPDEHMDGCTHMSPATSRAVGFGRGAPRSSTSGSYSRLLEDTLLTISKVHARLASLRPGCSEEELATQLEQAHRAVLAILVRSSEYDGPQIQVLVNELEGVIIMGERLSAGASHPFVRSHLDRLRKHSSSLDSVIQKQHDSAHALTIPSPGAPFGEMSQLHTLLQSEAAGRRRESEQLQKRMDSIAQRLNEKEQYIQSLLMSMARGGRGMGGGGGQHGWDDSSHSYRQGSYAHTEHFGRETVEHQAGKAAMMQAGMQQGVQPNTPAAPINIHVGVQQTTEQATEQATEQVAESKSTTLARFWQTTKHKMLSNSSPLLIGGAIGFAMHLLLRGSGLPLLSGGGGGGGGGRRPVVRERQRRRDIAREARRQLRACEIAYHGWREHSQKAFRTPFDAPRAVCNPEYVFFDEGVDTDA